MIEYKHWGEVPEHLKSKTSLSKEGFKPNEIRAKVYQRKGRVWIDLYDINEAIPKKKATPKQLAALEKAREKAMESRTCEVCFYVESYQTIEFYNGKRLCRSCYEYEQIKTIIEDARSIFLSWKENDFIIIDTETTGLSLWDEIIEISCLDSKGNLLYDTLVKPTIPIPSDATEIHGITNEDVSSAPTWEKVWKEIEPLLISKKILIYNKDFDISKISHCCSLYNLDLPILDSDCVMQTYADYVGSTRWMSLSNAVGYYIGHRAKNDSYATLELIQRVWDEINDIRGNGDGNV